MLPEGTVLVRADSVRAHAAVKAVAVACYFSRLHGGGWYAVPENAVDGLLTVRGITRARWRDDLRPVIFGGE